MSRIIDLRKLELGKLYWIITDSQWTDGDIDLDYLKICNRFQFVDTINRMDDGRSYIFIDPLDYMNPSDNNDSWQISEFSTFFIFDKIDSFYRYIYEAVQCRLGELLITEEVKEIFKQSQDINPEEWI